MPLLKAKAMNFKLGHYRASHISAVVSKPVVELNANAGTLVPKGWTVGDVTVTQIGRLGAYVPVGSGIEVTHSGGTTFLRDVTLANFTRRMLDAIKEGET